MYEMERFIQSELLLIILTIWAVLYSDATYGCLMVSGMLMIILTWRSLSEKQSGMSGVMQVIFSIVFAVMTKEYLSYLIFYEWDYFPKIIKKQYSSNQTDFSEVSKETKESDTGIDFVRILFPGVAYGIWAFVMKQTSIPFVICNIIILLIISGVLCTIEWMMVKYISATQQISKAVTMTAVNEMYAKNLNRELVIKNYLADKNARLQERENISRNIHNSVGHSITAAVLALEAADMLYDSAPDKAREKMNTANERIKTSLSSIRHAVRVLDSENKFISINDLIKELQAIADDFVMDTMIQIHTDFLNVSEDTYIYHEHTEFLTGALQELLTNGVRHGNADVFVVILTADSGHVKLMVSDNGHSDFSEANRYEKIQKGFGLKKIITYAKRSGGAVSVSNDNGFRIEITLRLLKEECNSKI